MARPVSRRSKFGRFEREARQIKELERSVEKHVWCAIIDAIKIGRLLLRVKKGLKKGLPDDENFLTWLENNYGSHDRAERRMHMAKLAARYPDRFRKLRNLKLAQDAFLRLMSPGVDDREIEDVVARSKAGERVTTKQISFVVRHSPRKIVTPFYPGPTKYLVSEAGSCEPVESPEAQSAPAPFRHSLEAGEAVTSFLKAAAAVAENGLPSAQDLADAVKANKTLEALTASRLHELAALLNALATELDHP